MLPVSTRTPRQTSRADSTRRLLTLIRICLRRLYPARRKGKAGVGRSSANPPQITHEKVQYLSELPSVKSLVSRCGTRHPPLPAAPTIPLHVSRSPLGRYTHPSPRRAHDTIRCWLHAPSYPPIAGFATTSVRVLLPRSLSPSHQPPKPSKNHQRREEGAPRIRTKPKPNQGS